MIITEIDQQQIDEEFQGCLYFNDLIINKVIEEILRGV